MELPEGGGGGRGIALVSWVAFWKENVVIFLEKKDEKVQLLKRTDEG